MGSIGGQELLLILVLALLLFGPRKLPEIGRTIGRALSEFRGASHEFRSSLEREVELERGREGRERSPVEGVPRQDDSPGSDGTRSGS